MNALVTKELHFNAKDASPMFVDSQSALTVLMDPQHHGRMKHLDINIHCICDVIKKGVIIPHHIPSDDNTANILTKDRETSTCTRGHATIPNDP